jgi:hypothetical protein
MSKELMVVDSKVNYGGCLAFVYNSAGTCLGSFVIKEHDKETNTICFLGDTGDEQFAINTIYDIFIRKPDKPRRYKGKFEQEGDEYLFRLFAGRNGEKRKNKRYVSDITASLIELLDDELNYLLCEPIVVDCLNISKGGLRFVSEPNTVSLGDNIKAVLSLNENKSITFEVVNMLDKKDSTEYGCKFTSMLVNRF